MRDNGIVLAYRSDAKTSRKVFLCFHSGHYYQSPNFSENTAKIVELLQLQEVAKVRVRSRGGCDPFRHLTAGLPVYAQSADALLRQLTHHRARPVPLSAIRNTVIEDELGSLPDALRRHALVNARQEEGVPRTSTQDSTLSDSSSAGGELGDILGANDAVGSGPEPYGTYATLSDGLISGSDWTSRKFVIHVEHTLDQRWRMQMWLGPAFTSIEDGRHGHQHISMHAKFVSTAQVVVSAGHVYWAPDDAST